MNKNIIKTNSKIRILHLTKKKVKKKPGTMNHYGNHPEIDVDWSVLQDGNCFKKIIKAELGKFNAVAAIHRIYPPTIYRSKHHNINQGRLGLIFSCHI